MPKVSYEFTFKNGESITLYYVGSLCRALGRTSQCVRKWEIGGVIPDTCFKDPEGFRLYSKEQIDAIVSCAEKARLSQGRPISHTTFSSNVHKELGKLRAEYAQKMK